MPLSVIAIGLSLLGGLGGLAVAATFLLFPASTRSRLVPWLVSYAVGVMLGVTLLAILPQAIESLPPVQEGSDRLPPPVAPPLALARPVTPAPCG